MGGAGAAVLGAALGVGDGGGSRRRAVRAADQREDRSRQAPATCPVFPSPHEAYVLGAVLFDRGGVLVEQPQRFVLRFRRQ